VVPVPGNQTRAFRNNDFSIGTLLVFIKMGKSLVDGSDGSLSELEPWKKS